MTENRTANLQLEIDRLVGGELDQPAKRKLVDLLDSTPDGWRCCALAYMEADSWKRAFGSLLADDAETDKQDGRFAKLVAERRSHTTTEIRPRRQSATRTRSTLALVVTVAFVAGLGCATAWSRFSHDSRRSGNLANESKNPPSNATPSMPNPDDEGAPNRQPPEQLVGLVSVRDNGVMETAFAVIGDDDDDSPPPEFAQQPVADYVRQVWQRRGFAIEQHRKIVSVKIADGRRFHFPVDWVQYRPIGRQIF